MTVLKSKTIAEAARLMLDCQSEVLPVVTYTGAFRGLLTNEDIVSHLLRRGSWNDEIDLITGRPQHSTKTPCSNRSGIRFKDCRFDELL